MTLTAARVLAGLLAALAVVVAPPVASAHGGHGQHGGGHHDHGNHGGGGGDCDTALTKSGGGDDDDCGGGGGGGGGGGSGSGTTGCDENTDCQVTVEAPDTTFTVAAPSNPNQPDSGSVSAAVNQGAPLNCPGYTERSPDWVTFFASTPNRGKRITIVYHEGAPNLTGILAVATLQHQACFGAPYTFQTRLGSPALANQGGEYVGQLPGCLTATFPPPGPCVRSKVPSITGDTTVVVELPPSVLDPRLHT